LPSTEGIAGSMTRADTVAAEKKKRSPWTWPLIALIALLAIVLIGAVFALTNQGSPTPDKTTKPPATSSTPTPTPTVTTPPAPTTAAIVEADFIGLTADEARAKLGELGMTADVQEGNAATNSSDAGKVYAVNPTGKNVAVGTTITVTVWAAPAALSAPSSAPSLADGTEPFAPGSDVKVTWPAQSCPAGQTLSGYKIAVSGEGAAISVEDTSANGSRSAVITAGSAPFSVTFQYFCGEFASPASPALDVDVQEPAEEPGAKPTDGPATGQ
ncbi:MAG: PASTA domain-containing protein, partial [Mycetocola sp.]